MMWAKGLKNILLDFIFPRNIYCIICNKPINKDEKFSLCSHCRREIKFLPDRSINKGLEPCYYTKAFSTIEYDIYAKKIIYDLKYKGKRYLSYHVAEIMFEQLEKVGLTEYDFIIPVPLHRDKEALRSFNQSYLIGKYLSQFTGKPILKDALIRVKDTKEQSKLTKEERLKNIYNAFKAFPDMIINKDVLLVDDVITTGSTVNEASKALVKAGVKNIYVMTFATGDIGGEKDVECKEL